MHGNLDLILTLTGGLAAALALGYVTHRVGLSPIVGYLQAGIAVGPNTPGFVADPHLAEQLAEVGVILLMFGVGLHFSFRDLMSVRSVVPCAIAQIALSTLLGLGLGRLLGWDLPGALVFGLGLAVASTVVTLRALQERRRLGAPVVVRRANQVNIAQQQVNVAGACLDTNPAAGEKQA